MHIKILIIYVSSTLAAALSNRDTVWVTQSVEEAVTIPTTVLCPNPATVTTSGLLPNLRQAIVSSTFAEPSSSFSSSSTSSSSSTTSSSSVSATSSSTSTTSSSSNVLHNGPGASDKSYTGDLTWYDTGLGACGWSNTPSDHIVAVSESIFDFYEGSNSNNNPICGKTVTITGVNGRPYTAKVVDRCTGCETSDLDLSQQFFNEVTDNGDGRVSGVTWRFN